MKLTFNQWVFLKVRPKMLCKPCAGQMCTLVPFDDVGKGRKPDWQYALVDKEKKMYKMVFESEDDIIDSLFKAKEIWYGSDIWPNPLYGKETELRVEYDFSSQ